MRFSTAAPSLLGGAGHESYASGEAAGVHAIRIKYRETTCQKIGESLENCWQDGGRCATPCEKSIVDFPKAMIEDILNVVIRADIITAPRRDESRTGIRAIEQTDHGEESQNRSA
eukprot:SAG31_NODE_2738_length_5158_cov_1.907492_2_plen_115_part_00